MALISVVKLKGTSKDSDFTGFLIQARTVGDDSPVGTFDSGTLHKQVCTGKVCFNCEADTYIIYYSCYTWVKHFLLV